MRFHHRNQGLVLVLGKYFIIFSILLDFFCFVFGGSEKAEPVNGCCCWTSVHSDSSRWALG